MDIRFVICAQGVALDQRHNTLSIFHAIEELNVPAFPFVLPFMTVVALLERLPEEPNEPEGLQFVIALGEQELVSQPLMASFQGRLRMRTVTEVAGIVVPNPGVLRVTLRDGANQTCTWPIVINNIARPIVQPVLPLQ